MAKQPKKRAYDTTTRAAAAAGTRQRIIDAAHRLLARSDGNRLSGNDIAAEAGVSRATLYKSIGSRAQLLAAVFEDQGRLIGYDRVRAAGRHPNARSAVIDTMKQLCRAWSVMPASIRRVLALAALDEEVGMVVRRYERYRGQEIAALARRAYEARSFGSDITLEDATRTLITLTSFPVFDALHQHVGRTAATRHLLRMTKHALDIQ